MKSTPTAPDRICPGCDGPKSRRARLCAGCRRRANAVGVSVLTHVHEAAIPAESPEPFVRRTPWQSKAYHGKCNDLARITKADMGETKKKTLAYASERFDRPLESSTELSEVEMELLLEWLTDEIDAREASRAARGRAMTNVVVDLGSNVYARLFTCAHSDGAPAGAIIQFGGTPDSECFDHDEVCCGSVSWCAECRGPTWELRHLEPLHIEPSVRTTCHNHPEHHGFIRGGRWHPC